MTEETQIDPPWTAALRRTLTEALREGTRSVLTTPGRAPLITAVLAAVLPHMETAYRVGRMAGSSASAARLAQKNLELSKKLREVRERATKAIWALKSPEPSGSEHYRAGWADGLEAAIDALRSVGDES